MASHTSSSTARLLQVISEVVERWSPTEIDRLSAELRDRLLVSNLPGKGEASKIRRTKTLNSETLIQAHQALLGASSRSDGQQILAHYNFNRRELEFLARAATVHVTKADTASAIEEKIVETIIGSRLNAAAILGET